MPMTEIPMTEIPMTDTRHFWKHKALEEMSPEEWEALCDGCARCCLNKLEDWDTGEIYWTAVACRLLDHDTCRCRAYADRQDMVSDCLALTPANIRHLSWLPRTCAYRLVAEERDLYWWHPLVSGDRQTVHAAGISVRGRIVAEDGIAPEAYEDYLVDWPGEDAHALDVAPRLVGGPDLESKPELDGVLSSKDTPNSISDAKPRGRSNLAGG